MWSKTFAAASFSALLAGCGQTVAVKTVCPPFVRYDAAFESAAADELAAMPDGSKVVRLVTDYGQLRAVLRACGSN